MIEAMYGVEFVSNVNDLQPGGRAIDDMGYGVVIFETGKILGGDSSYVYVGKYRTENGVLKVNVKVTNDRKVLTSIFGDLDEFHLYGEATLKAGEYQIKEFIVHGEMVEHPAMKIAVKFTRRAELP
jgi:hypothetical protein